MIGTHLKRGFLLTLLAVLAAFAPAALAQNGGGAVVPGPDTPAPGGNSLSPVTLSGGAVESPKLWTGEQQKFSVRVSVAEGTNLQSLQLKVGFPGAGEIPYPFDVNKLTAEQRTGKAPVTWLVTVKQDGLYTYQFLAQGVGSPDIVQFPSGNQRLTFRVDSLLKSIGFALGLIVAVFILAKLGLTGIFSRVVKNQTKIAPFSLMTWLIATVVIVWFFFLPWSIWVAVGAGIAWLCALIYVFV